MLQKDEDAGILWAQEYLQQDGKGRYSEVTYDPKVGKYQIGGNITKHHEPAYYQVRPEDVYLAFRRLEAGKIPKEVYRKWEEWYAGQPLCN